jgi:hypothetical protein
MNKSFADLSNLDTQDLIQELRNRGFVTQLLFGREDVQLRLDDINENRLGISDDNQIELSDNDMDDILNYVMDDDAVGQMVYEGIESRILAYDK